jgi:hypothetical protein
MQVFWNASEKKPYDGINQGILNMNNKYLFTHELLREGLNVQDNGRISIKGFFRAKLSLWKSSISSTHLHLYDVLNLSSLGDIFTDAVFDYITKLKAILASKSFRNSTIIRTDCVRAGHTVSQIDYDEGFKCQCRDKMFKNNDYITLIYDNSCNLNRSISLRCPSLLEYMMLLVDTLHFSGHKGCSPYFNKRRIVHLHRVNSAIAEQKNRSINYLETSASFMGQARAMVWMRSVALTRP